MLRRAGYVFLLLAVILLALDGYQWLQSGELQIAALGARWYGLHPASLNLSQAVIERYVWPPLWNPGITSILLLPSWVLPLVLGILLTYLGLRSPRDKMVFGKIKRRRR